jgi:hypothetical protein
MKLKSLVTLGMAACSLLALASLLSAQDKWAQDKFDVPYEGPAVPPLPGASETYSINYTGSVPAPILGALDADDSTYNRVLSGCSGLSGVGTAVYYDIISIANSTPLAASFVAETSDQGAPGSCASIDTFLTAYQPTFNPATPLTNCVAADDDGGPGNCSRMTFTVPPSGTAVIVMASFSNGATFPYQVNFTGTTPIGDLIFKDGFQAGVLLDSGPLITHPGGGAGGANASRLQNTSLTMNTLGLGHQVVNGNSVADDFTVPAGPGWTVTQMTFFAYQTGSTTTSTINDVRVRLWNGQPNAGGSVIWGDLTTNRLASTTFSNIYRDTETTVGNNTRPIMTVVATVPTSLAPGTYWVEWQMGGTLASGPWAPPITILGQTTTGNALQNLAGTWQAALDTGTGTPQGFKFIIGGTSP